MHHSNVVSFSLAILVAASLDAQTLFIPAAAHSAGMAGSSWRTDLELKATGSGEAVVRLELLVANQANQDPQWIEREIPAGRCARFEDLLGIEFGHTGNGALRLRALSGQVIATSRTYNSDPAGTFGQFIAAQPASSAFAFGDEASIIQLAENQGYRTNVGFLNVAESSTTIQVDLYEGPGTLLGSLSYTLAPLEYRQITRIFTAVVSRGVDDGFAMLRTTGASGAFLAYASVVDNRSNDAIFIPAQADQAEGGVEPPTGALIAGHGAAMVFDFIPRSAINAATARFGEIYYSHTSHGSQIITGLGMVEDLNAGHPMPDVVEEYGDLGSWGDLAWLDTTRTELSRHPDYSIVMWSWCGGVSDTDRAGIDAYLDAMSQLEAEYPNIVFIYMTGHLDGSGPNGNLALRNQQIRTYCEDNDKVLFDFADIESHDPDGNAYPWGSDWCEWCSDWCEAHNCPTCDDCAHSQCINCYQKGKAFWWLLARLAGWEDPGL